MNQNTNKPATPQDWRIDYFRDCAKAMYSLLVAVYAKNGNRPVEFDLKARLNSLRMMTGEDCEGGFNYSVNMDSNTFEI